MKKIFHIGLVLCLVSAAAIHAAAQSTEKTLRTYDWDGPEVQKNLPDSEIVSLDGISVLKIEHTNNMPLVVSLWSTTNPSLIKKAEFVSFDMKYENVSEVSVQHTNRYGFRNPFATTLDGRLTFVTHFPPPALGGDETTNVSQYYIEGTSNWKPYEFNVSPVEPVGLPNQLELKLFLPGNGTVYLRPIKLLHMAGSWWPAEQGGMIGGVLGIFGGIVGCLGGLLGCLAGFGKARKFVLTTTKLLIALGMLVTVTGIVAIICGQPFFVWYVFLLPGILLTLVFSLNFPVIQRRYDDLEIRRMASMDVMRG